GQVPGLGCASRRFRGSLRSPCARLGFASQVRTSLSLGGCRRSLRSRRCEGGSPTLARAKQLCELSLRQEKMLHPRTPEWHYTMRGSWSRSRRSAEVRTPDPHNNVASRACC